MKTEFALAFNEVLEDKGLPREVILDALESAMVSAYRRSVNASTAQHIEANIDLETGKVTIFAEKEIVDEIQDDRTEVSIAEAKKTDAEAEIGNMLIVESTPGDFGRVAAQTARQVIQQKIREAERAAQFEYFSKQEGEIISGIIQALNPQAVTLGLEMKAEGVMPRNQQIPREHFRLHDRVRALLLEVRSSSRGPQIIISRSHRDFLRRLLENEVPEIYHGLIEIRSISREPGHRSKVAVAALQPGVDPVGACVGIRGVRIQAIVRELNDEKIDVIEWNPDASAYIAKALSPARVTGVYLHDSSTGPNTATVVVPEDQLSLAIGRDGQNARLAAKLTSWRIDIKSLPEASSDVLYKMQNNPAYMAFADAETKVIEQIEVTLAKKAEGRPVTPEEYHVMSQFVDRIERTVMETIKAERKERDEKRAQASELIPDEAYELPIQVLGLATRTTGLLEGSKFSTVGDLMLAMHMDIDDVLGINGIGPKAIEAIQESINSLELKPAEEEVIEAAEEIVDEAVDEADSDAVEETTPEAVAETEAAEIAAADQVEDIPESETVDEETPDAEEELPESLEEIFKLRPDMIDGEETSEKPLAIDDQQEKPVEEEKPKKKKKKKKKYVEIEYDPDQDVTLYKRKRKRDSGDWDDEWEM